MALLRELHAEGLTVVLVTHEPSIAAAADRTIRVHDGQIVEDIRKPVAVIHPSAEPITDVPEVKITPKLHWNLVLLNFQQAARGLWGNKLRTCLSALGIIIGVAAVIVMLALGDAARIFRATPDRRSRLEPIGDHAKSAEHRRRSTETGRGQPPHRHGSLWHRRTGAHGRRRHRKCPWRSAGRLRPQ